MMKPSLPYSLLSNYDNEGILTGDEKKGNCKSGEFGEFLGRMLSEYGAPHHHPHHPPQTKGPSPFREGPRVFLLRSWR